MAAEIHFRVRYAETDRMGVTHHAVYPIWFEMLRTELCREIGLPYAEVEAAGVMSPLVGLQCRYRGTTTYDDPIVVRGWIAAYKGARMTVRYEVYVEGDETPRCTGESEHAWVDARTFAPFSLRRLFPQWHEALSRAVEDGDR